VRFVPAFPDYDPAIADAAKRLDQTTGLGGFLGITTAEVGPGTMTCRLLVKPELLNPFGMLHGGVVSSLVDHVLGAVCYPVIPRGSWAATTTFTVNLLAPVRDGVVEARAEIISMTKRTAVVRIDVTNDGRPVAAAQGTVSIQPPKPAAQSERS
jgi:1,4-dihydroxy-2-naphthoyl-CoA hydrolase